MSVNLKVKKFAAPAFIGNLRAEAADALNRAALAQESLAKQLAPIDTGFLRGSIQAGEPATARDLKAETGVGAEYGIYVELGTANSPAQPFFAPAFESTAEQLKTELKDILK